MSVLLTALPTNTNIGGGDINYLLLLINWLKFEHEISRCVDLQIVFPTLGSRRSKSWLGGHIHLSFSGFRSFLYECEDGTIKLATTASFYLFSYWTSILIFHLTVVKRDRGTSICMVKGYGLDRWGWDPGSDKMFLFSTTSGLGPRPTHLPIQWVLWTIPPG